MKLFHQFTTLLQIHKKSPAVWIQKKINEKSLFYIISKFEGGGNDLGIATYTKLEDMPNQFSVKTALKWFDFVLAALDSYFYVFQEKLITPATIWKDKSSTKLFESLKYFTRNIAHVDMHQAAQSISNNDCTFTPREINSYNNLKSTVSTRILQFVKILVKLNKENSFINELIPSDMWKEDTIFGLLSAAIVSPSSLGFHTDEDFTVAKQISDLSSQLLQSLSENFSPNRASNDTFLKDLFSILRKQLLKHGSLKDLLPQPFGSADMSNNVVNLHDLLRAYSVLINRRVLGDVLAGEGEDFEGCVEFGKKIFQLVYRSVVTNESSNNQDGVLFHHLSPSDVALGKSLLELAFVSGIPAECLVHSLFTSSNKILVGETKSNDVHVSLFLSLFSDEIYSHLCASASIYVPLICGNASDHPFMCCLILSGMLEHLAVNRIARKKYASCVCRLILREWDGSLTCLWSFSQMHLHQDTLNDVIVILMKMFALDSSACKDSSNPKFNVVFDLYVEILKEESLPLSFKTKALDLLSFFTLSTAHAPKLKEALETMIVHHLPLSSKELTSGTNSFNDYVSTIRKLLNCVQDSGNLMVLEILINVFCREDDHILSEEVQSAFENAASRIPLEKQKQALSIPYKFYADLNRYSFAFRHRCVTKVLVVMAARCDVTAVIEFFACNVVEITTFIKEENVKWPESKLAEQLCMKTLAYSLMELMFVILPSQQIVPSSSIGYAYSNAADPSQSKDSLLKTFMKCANRDRNQNTQQATMLVEEQRRFQCSVYNAMIAAVICTQADQPWYKAFLFDENIKKNQYFLDNVIDMSREYEFDTEATEPLKQRKRFVAIRSQMHKKQDNEENDVSYMASVFESSLCEDVTVFDGNAGRLMSHSSKLGAAESSAMDVGEPKSDSCFGNFLNLEGDQLNQHECMATMVALIKHMHQNNIGLPPEDEDCDKLPPWMNAIHKKLSSTSSHKNVRLFITKLIINCEECFRRFASFWIAPLVQTYIRGDLGENGINSMVCDVMATVLSWNSIAIPEDTVEGRHLVQAIVEKLSKSVKSASRDIIRHNLYVLKTTLECWGKRIVAGIDPSIVYSLCDSSDLQSKENYSGLQLLGAMLVNDVAPYLPSYAVGRTAYFSRIFRNLLNKRKEIYDSTSEVAGMTLRHLTHVERDADGEIHSMVVEKLNDILVRSKEQDKFITCFHKVVLRYPEIVDKFLSKIFFIIPKLHGELRVKAFEILLQRGPKIPDLYRELKSKNLVSMLAVGDASLQLVSLRLSHCMLQLAIDTKDPKQFDDAVSYILPSIVEHFLSHVIPSCREEAFSIVMDVYDFLKTQSAEQRNDTALSTSRVFLFKALSDPEEALRNQVVNFWNDEQAGRLPVEAFSKLQVIFCDLYDPSLNEVEFLSNTIGLLLQCTSLSPDFERPVFDHPLSDCTFLEYAINTDWRHRHAGSSLRFIDTLQTAERSSLDETSAPRQSKSNVVAATQENQLFSATIAGNTRNTYNWMTGNSLDTFSSFSDVEAPERKSSLFANSSSSRRHITERLAGSTLQKDAHFGQKLLSYEVKGEAKKASGIEIDVQRLRKRFTKEAKDSPYKYARVQEQKRKKREQANKDRHSKLENQVQLYRKYRTGELPDIQIPNKSIIVPLAAACQHDATLSQYLMSSLILSFVKEEMKREELSGDEEQQNSKIVKISEDLAEILRASEEKCPSLIGCIEDVIFRDEDKIKKIDPSDVTSASIAANTQSLGIAVLEQYLLNSKHTVDIQAKRRKLTERSTNDDIDIWVALSRLYKSLGEFDVLHGIFSERGGFNSKTAEGLSMEVNGNYKTAYKIYQKALQENWDGSEVTEVEKDLWEDGLMNSLKNLSRWDQVNKLCNEHLSAFLEDSSQTHNLRLENSWKFPEFQDKYLDTSLHAKLMMLLQGNADAGNELASFIDDALKMGGETQKKVEKRFAEYLVILYIFQREYDRANYYLQVAIENFATNWSLLNVVMKEKQEEMLRILPRFTDIQDFLDVICKADGDYTFDCVSNLVMKWTNHDIYSRHDSASAWHDLILYRCFFVDRLKSRFEQVHSNDPALTSRVNKSKITMQLQIIESASLSNNFAVAKTTINRLEEVYDVIESDNELCVKLAHHTASMYHSQVNYQKVMSRDNPTCSINFLLAAYESLNAQSNVIGQLGSKSIAAVNHLVLLAKTYDLVCQNSSNLTDDVRDDVTNMVSSAQDSSNIQNALQSQAFLFYQKAAERASELIDSSDEVMSMQYKAYMALTEFCDERLRFHGEATSQSSTHNNEVITYAVTMTRSILKSMCIDGGGRAIAFLKFPRILQLTEKFESVRRVFIKETAALPVWMFLAWIGHMIALLDGETASIVQPIIHRMADEYPQAVVYPFMTALKDLKLNCSQQFKNHKSFVKRLKHKLQQDVPLADEFIKQLQFVSDPLTVFKDWRSEFQNLLEDRKKNKVTTNDVMESYQNMYNDFFDCVNTSQTEESSLYDSPCSQKFGGALWSKFANAYKKDVDELFGGSIGNKLPSMPAVQAKKYTDKLFEKMKTFNETARTLKDCSLWLADFQTMRRGGSLEIPGQYDGRSRPLLEYHVDIVGFDDRVVVMKSKQKPCRITICGSDEKNYQFLVKGGEDLRQDQRIESIFRSINDILSGDSQSRKKKLSIITYQVVPVSSKIGMIEWVKNTLPYWDFLSKQAERMNCKPMMDSLQKTEWIPPAIKKKAKNVVELYGQLMKEVSYTEVINKFNEISKKLPDDILRKGYLYLSGNPESFLTLRKQFVTSYAVMCVTHWLLGIGDRHTSNFLISMKSGHTVGIDFGHAFGSGTEVLPVPELVPFRLTPQIVGLLSPHSEKRGELRQVMIRCLSALRLHSDAILAILDVFIKDPSVDWTRFAKKSRQMDSSSYECGDVSDRTWYAQRKVKIVARKLGGENPGSVTCDEVEHNANVRSYCRSYQGVARGAEGRNIRARSEEDNLSVDAQVDCLIDQAADPNILGRMYSGWKSWL